MHIDKILSRYFKTITGLFPLFFHLFLYYFCLVLITIPPHPSKYRHVLSCFDLNMNSYRKIIFFVCNYNRLTPFKCKFSANEEDFYN